MSRFYEAGPIRQIAINLFYGYGYNFYRAENQLRDDDQRVRELASALLGQARAAIVKAESAYRHQNIQPPTRECPFPDKTVIANAQALKRLAQQVGALEGRVRNQPVPTNDRMTQRYREEAATLTKLAEHDALLVGQAELLRALLEKAEGDAMLAQRDELEVGIDAIETTLRDRQRLLL